MKKLLIALIVLLLSALPAMSEEIKGKVVSLSDKEITLEVEKGKTTTLPIKAGSHVHHMCAVNEMVILTVEKGVATSVKQQEEKSDTIHMHHDEMESEEDQD